MESDFDPAATAPAERVTRLLAAHAPRKNGEGDMGSAAAAVDALWPEPAAAALAVMRTLREPSGRTLAGRDADLWDPMIGAAIEDETISES